MSRSDNYTDVQGFGNDANFKDLLVLFFLKIK